MDPWGLELLAGACGRDEPPVPDAALTRAIDLLEQDELPQSELVAALDAETRLRYRLAILAQGLDTAPVLATLSPAQRVLRMGRMRAAGLVWVLAIGDAVLRWGTAHPRVRDQLWRHLLLTGVIAHQLVRQTGQVLPGDVFSAGVAHDLGHLLMRQPAPRLGVVWHAEHDTWERREKSLAPERDHCRLGQVLLDYWDAPDPLVETALHHHEPTAATFELQPLVALVRMADLVAEHVEQPAHGPPLMLEEMAAWKELALLPPWDEVPDLHHELLASLPDSLLTMERLAGLLGS